MRESIPPIEGRAILTIGNFDGVHLGHQYVLKRVVEVASKKKAKAVVITFRNHPHTILHRERKTALLTSPDQKAMLLSQLGINHVIQLPFTEEFSQISAVAFLDLIRRGVAFTDLILGYDARFGKDREGNRELLQEWSKRSGVEVEYLDPVQIEGQSVSSSQIRKFIMAGQLEEAAKYLGRSYAFYGPVVAGNSVGKQIGFPTLNMDVALACLPPLGVYIVDVCVQDRIYRGVANLGYAPTVRSSESVLLEVHLFSEEVPSDTHLEVILKRFIRPEMRFPSLEALQAQIQKDVEEAKKANLG